jgi:oligopeptide transport system substrate-binding protein
MRSRAILPVVGVLVAALVVAAALGFSPARPSRGAADDTVSVLLGEPSTLDPAAQSDAESAAITAQLFESLTAFDASLTLRPALAASWSIEAEGRRVRFRLRDGLAFSDGSPLTAADVVRSWLRLVDPRAPSPLAALMLAVSGARERLAGTVDEEAVGIRAEGNEVVVDLERPGADLPAIVSGPSFAVVPRAVGTDPASRGPDGFVGSGGYVLESREGGTLVLRANEHYWAGTPAIGTVRITTDLAQGSPVQAFADGDLDYAGIGQADAAWIAYDADLGSSLREIPSFTTEYLGFDTTRTPFDRPEVRRAIGMAVDWRRVVELATPDDAIAATSMVPPDLPGRGAASFLPAHDPDRARRLLADAGYPGGRGFPPVTFMSGGTAYAEGILADLDRELGIRPSYRTTEFDTFFRRLDREPPEMWTLSWIADYPGRNDFLGVLLGTGATNNYGGWSSAEFDAAIEDAGSTLDPARTSAAYARAERIVQRDVPVVPLAHGRSWALARHGLLGAGTNGLGILRMAGLAWAP